MSPATKAYLDMKYTPDTPLGLTWAGMTSVRDAYGWDPGDAGARRRRARLLGVEAPLWTETAATRADLDYLVFPRLLGPRRDRLVAGRRASRGGATGWRLAAHGAAARALGVGFYALARGALALSGAQAGPGDRAEARVQLGARARAPVPRAARRARPRRRRQLLGVAAALLAEEVRRRRAAADELDVDVPPAAVDVAQQAAVPVALVEPGSRTSVTRVPLGVRSISARSAARP